MIAYLRGILARKNPGDAIIEVGGVGYHLLVSGNTSRQLPPEGSPLLIYTHLVHREDAMTLFGFSQSEEREMFLKLTGVSGIGNKTALGILSRYSPGQIAEAVIANRPEGLTCPGVGKKTAARIVLELREKLRGVQDLPVESPRLDAELALSALGYTSDEIQESLMRMPPELGTDDLIRRALEWLSAK